LDQRQTFVVSALYDLPFGRGKMFGSNWGRGLDTVLGGWQLNTIVQAGTGTPFSLVYPDYGGNYSIRASTTAPIRLTHSIRDGWFDTSTIFHPASGQEGNVGRNAIYGPGYVQGDVSIFKTLTLTQRLKTELRAEAFNITNTPQFTNPDGNPTDGNFGFVTGTRQASERQLQMAVRILF